MENFQIAYSAFLNISKSDLLRTSYRYAASTSTRWLTQVATGRDIVLSRLRDSVTIRALVSFQLRFSAYTIANLRYMSATPFISGLSLMPQVCICGTDLLASIDLAQIDERQQPSFTSCPFLAPSGWDSNPVK